jgi:hypothetical protein
VLSDLGSPVDGRDEVRLSWKSYSAVMCCIYAIHSALASGEDDREESSLDLNWVTDSTKYFIHADRQHRLAIPMTSYFGYEIAVLL